MTARLRPEPEAVVLLHGLGRSRASMRRLEKALQAQGYDALNWGYPSRYDDLAGLAARFDALLASLAGRAGRVHFVGHSLGAILIRLGLRQPVGFALGRIVMLAPPNRGATVVSRLSHLPWLTRLFGRPAAELAREAPWLLQAGTPATAVGIIAGTRRWHPLSPSSWVNNLLRLPRPHDGTVELASTPLEGMHDFIAIHANHTHICRHPEAIHQTLAFLAHGRFERGREPGGWRALSRRRFRQRRS